MNIHIHIHQEKQHSSPLRGKNPLLKKKKASGLNLKKGSKNQPIDTLPVMGYEIALTPDTDE